MASQHLPGLAGYLDVLPSGDDERGDGCSRVADDGVGGRGVAIGVDPDAEESESFCSCRADCGIVLTDPASKDKYVQAVHGRRHGGYLAPQPVQVHLDRQPGGRVAVGSGPLHITHVA